MEHKNIDRLFQEKLKDVEITPNPKVWNAIEKKLQKKKRRVLPFWWFYGGTAAVLLLGMFLVFNKNNQQDVNDFPVITNEELKINKENNKLHKSIKIDDLEVVKKEVLISEKQEKKSLKINNNQEFNKKNKNISNVLAKKNTQKSNEIINFTTERKRDVKTWGGFNSLNKSFFYKKLSFSNTSLILIEDKKVQTVSEGEITTISSSDIIVLKDSSISKEKTKRKNFITEMSSEKETQSKKDEKGDWAISPIVGVLRANSFSQSSALDDDLNDNPFSGENTFSFGVNVTYELNEKWAIKSGVQLQESVFITNNVSLNSSAVSVANTLDNVFSESNNNSDDVVADEALSPNSGNNQEGNLQQNYSYIEVPLEIKYTLFSSKKLQTSVISGFSSLILNENSITSESENFSQNIGGANNLNTINFSGNIGLDFNFLLSKKMTINVNPVFKTQLNTFSKNSNGFKPYLIGVYTGVIYHF